MTNPTNILWLRQDLRLDDNPALYEATKSGKFTPIYILDDQNAGEYRMGSASRVWLHHTLESLNTQFNNQLHIYKGDADEIIERLVSGNNVRAIYWNRCYEPWRIKRDSKIKERLIAQGLDVNSYNGSLLFEPWEILKDDGAPYRVFTPFYKKGCLNAKNPRTPLAAPAKMDVTSLDSGSDSTRRITVEELNLLPKVPWNKSIEQEWQISEDGALHVLDCFLSEGIGNYKEGRDFPAQNNISRLSPYLHFGQISPNRVWHTTRRLSFDRNVEHFCSELGWREFSYYLLYHNPEMSSKNLQSNFDQFPWHFDHAIFEKWQRGLTGYPLIDAGMRQLWQTGYMHNRVRMVVGSFLVKNLLIDWRHGERWFWDCLVDADLANNSASWQWVAGSGADAAPYFRIFNPVTQGEKFDANGEYVKQYLPELAGLASNYIHSPWEAPEYVLSEAGVILGKNYPTPIVDLATSRKRALEAYATIRKGQPKKG